MIKVFSSDDRLRVQQIKDLLESYNIPCFIKNEYAIGAIGELSPFDSSPEVWLADGEWFKRASQLIADFESENQNPGTSWVCQQCQERNEANFEICWQCGTELKI